MSQQKPYKFYKTKQIEALGKKWQIALKIFAKQKWIKTHIYALYTGFAKIFLCFREIFELSPYKSHYQADRDDQYVCTHPVIETPQSLKRARFENG